MINRPDGMLGAVLASESFGLCDTLINGAGGCRSRAMILLNELVPEYVEEGEECCRSKFFSRQSKLPCTFINGDDIVFGTGPKVAEGVKSLHRNGKGTALVDTLSASLVCADYSRHVPPEMAPVMVDADLAGTAFEEGFDMMTEALLRNAGIEGGESPMSVNLLGYDITDRGWTYGADEVRRLLAPMGVDVTCIPGCLPSEDSVRASGSAALNVVMKKSYCARTAEWYRREFGIPCLVPSEGYPLGYSACRSFVREVASALGADPAPSLRMIDDDERVVRRMLLKMNRAVDMLRGKCFSVEADSSISLPLVKWMYGKMMMVPASVSPFDDARSDDIGRFLRDVGFGEAFRGSREERFMARFTDGITAKIAKAEGSSGPCVPVSFPWAESVNLTGRCLVGLAGSRCLLEDLVNGIDRFRCGQPFYADMRRSPLGAGYLHELLDHVMQIVRGGGVHGPVVDLLPLAPALYQPGLLEGAEVVRHRGAGHSHDGGHVVHAPLVMAQQPEDAEPGPVGQLVEDRGHHVEALGLCEELSELLHVLDVPVVVRQRLGILLHHSRTVFSTVVLYIMFIIRLNSCLII
ncbi:MAG: hypothetical protein IKH98_07575 [Candidatus Methanomethylophilaceae archaeon]|nr:hypothetical protein [Candidatus Methanomethylophilaceae archaeon]